MGSWCPVLPQTRSCNTYVMLCQTQRVSCVWRSGCLPLATLLPVTTMWLLYILIWTGWVTLLSQLLCVTMSVCVRFTMCRCQLLCVSCCVSLSDYVCHCVEGLHEFACKTKSKSAYTHCYNVKVYRLWSAGSVTVTSVLVSVILLSWCFMSTETVQFINIRDWGRMG